MLKTEFLCVGEQTLTLRGRLSFPQSPQWHGLRWLGQSTGSKSGQDSVT